MTQFLSGSQCAQSYPYVYYKGSYCCKYNIEGTYAPQGATCDGGPLGFDSSCCKNNKYIKCESAPCSNYGSSGSVIHPQHHVK